MCETADQVTADASHLLLQLQSFFQLITEKVACNILVLSNSYTGRAEAVSHEEIKSGTGLSPCDVYAAAAVMENSLAQVSTLFNLLFKQQISKLKEGEENFYYSHFYAIKTSLP